MLLLLSHFSHVRLCVIPQMSAHQAPPSLGFSRQDTRVGCHFLLQCMKVKLKVKSLSCVRLFATPCTAAHQAPPSMGFSRQEDWRGLPSLPWTHTCSQTTPAPFSCLASPFLAQSVELHTLQTLVLGRLVGARTREQRQERPESRRPPQQTWEEPERRWQEVSLTEQNAIQQ